MSMDSSGCPIGSLAPEHNTSQDVKHVLFFNRMLHVFNETEN